MRLPVFVLALLSLALPLEAQEEIQSKDGRLGIVQAQSGPRVRDDRGQSNPLRIADEVELSSLVGMRSGWLAAGDRPVGPRRDLYFRMLDAGGLKSLPAPPGQVQVLRRAPVVLSDGESLQGVLWLEGDDSRSLAVRASTWLGITWSGPVEVSHVGPGTQTALDATVLSDGSWIAVWSAYDGQDDEIMWSLGVDGSWTTPSPLSANSVPDILPTVVASEHGALVAWNQFEGGEYRVVTTQLVDGRWTEPRGEAGGTLYPELVLLDGQPTLMFLDLSGERSVWRVQELDRDSGEVVRGAVVPRDVEGEPLLLRSANGPYLEWPRAGEKRPVIWERR